jgi:hypothetical protein
VKRNQKTQDVHEIRGAKSYGSEKLKKIKKSFKNGLRSAKNIKFY